MASHFKWYPSETETVVPFNARYSFPSQVSPFICKTFHKMKKEQN